MLQLPDDLLSCLVAAHLGPAEISSVTLSCRRMAALLNDRTDALQTSLMRLGLGPHLPTAKERYSRLAKWEFTPSTLGMSRVAGVYPWRIGGVPCFVMIDIGAHFAILCSLHYAALLRQ